MQKDKVTLREHLDMVDQNSSAGPGEISSLNKRLKKKFKDLGYPKVSKEMVDEYIHMIFETQDYRCTHWLPVEEGQLNGVWNRPMPKYAFWRISTIQYEIDHVQPVNSGGIDCLENFQFLSANANQFVKCSLTYQDLLKRVDLSDSLKERIKTVMGRRIELFKSAKWCSFVRRLKIEGR